MKVKISTKSWHYKLLSFYNFSHPPNLCAYFWKTVGTVLATPFIFIMVMLILPIIEYFDNRREHKPYNPKFGMKIAAAMKIFFYVWTVSFLIFDLTTAQYVNAAIMAALIGLVLFVDIRRIQRIRRLLLYRHEEPKPKKEKEPNLMVEYIKAKKSKYCPMIEFTGMDERKDEEWNKWR